MSHILSLRCFLEAVCSYCSLTPTQTHLPFPPRLLPLPSDLQPRPSPSFRLTCRKREVLLVGSQWNSTVLSCEGSTWGSITPTDSGTSAGTGWQAGSKPQPSPTTRPSKPESGLEGSLLPPTHRCPGCGPLAGSTSTRPAAAAPCTAGAGRGKPHAPRSEGTARHGSQVRGCLGIWEPVPAAGVGRPSHPPRPHLASHPQGS